jgi:hypothetical protein
MLAAAIAWFALAVVADLVALVGSAQVVDLDSQLAGLIRPWPSASCSRWWPGR